MDIIVAENSGFCFGVKEAIKKTQETIKENEGKSIRIYTYGPLIHNAQVTQELEKQGVRCVDSLEDIQEGSIVIVRSHGVQKSFYQQAEQKKIKVVDATCRHVRKIQETARQNYEKGKKVIIIGNKNHPEVTGINGWCDNSATIIENKEDAKAISSDNICIVAQTTITKSLWDDVMSILDHKALNMDKYNTICFATEKRQKSCEKTAKQVDAMIIIGGKHSSNTQKLYAISKKFCKNSYFIETKDDLPLNDFKKYNKIGIAAGASTPEWIIKEVITVMSETSFHGETETTKESDSENQMYDLMDEIEKSLRIPGRGEIVKGTIIQVSDSEIVVNLGCKKDGIIPKEEITTNSEASLTSMYNYGDEIEAQVLKTDDGEGNLLLSKKKLEANEHWNEISQLYRDKSTIEVKVKNKVRGGVIAAYKEISGFIPISQLSDRYIENVNEFIGKVLPVKVTQLDKKKNKIIFSHRTYLDEEKARNVEKIWNSISVGDIVEGKVMRFTDYGAFVDIGGIDGLLHISEISWGKISHPSDVLKIGETINVKILSVDKENEKVSLGLKQTTAEPWEQVDSKYHVGEIIDGKVVQIKEYGVFVEIEPGMDGLVHISEMAHKHVASPASEVQIGEIVKAQILDIDKENKRISLSIKETLEKPENDDLQEKVIEKVQEATEGAAGAVKEEVQIAAEDSIDEAKNEEVRTAEDAAETVKAEVQEAAEENNETEEEQD